MFFLTYVSAAVTWFSSAELRALLDSSRLHNERAGITGMLLYKEGNFMQVLEGDEAAVNALQSRIAVDRRHQGIVTIDTGFQSQRQFSAWSMAFCDLDDAGAQDQAGYSEFLHTPLIDPLFVHDPSRSRKLLTLFRAIT